MNLYLNNEYRQIIINGIAYELRLTTIDVQLLSSDNYILQDSEGIYLLAKGEF